MQDPDRLEKVERMFEKYSNGRSYLPNNVNNC